MLGVLLARRREIDRLFPGDYFGEIALTVSERRVADVFALGAPRGGSRADIANTPLEKLEGPTELFQLSRVDFEEIMAQFPIVRTRLAESGQIKRRLKSVREVYKTGLGVKGLSSNEDDDDVDDGDDDAEAGSSSLAASTNSTHPQSPPRADKPAKKGVMGRIKSMFSS